MVVHSIVIGSLVAVAAHGSPERAVRVQLPSREARAAAVQLGVGFLEGGRGPWRHLAVSEQQARQLEALGYPVEPLPPPPPDGVDGYPTLEEIEARLSTLATSHPDAAALVEVGRSERGRSIWGLRVGTSDTPELGWRILGDHHGDEPVSGVVALALAEHILDEYGRDERITRLVDTDAIWIVPVVNPDGVAGSTRYNADGVDLNRNYGHLWSDDEFRSGNGPFSEAETRAVRAHGAWTGLGAGLSLHSGETNIGWVWNHTTTPTSDAALLEAMARDYGAACSTPGFWLTNGADWYPTRGDANDWAYGRHGVLDFTVEVSLVKAPPASSLPAVVSDHISAALAFLDWPHRAVGRVVDSHTGLPVPATVRIGDAPLTTSPDGRFGRPVPAAGATARVEAPGYAPVSLELTPGTVSTITMVPTGLAALRPSPRVLSRTGTGDFDLGVSADTVRLVRAGEADVSAVPDGDGWQVDPTVLAPGPWSLWVDGVVAPRSIFVGEVDSRVTLDAALVDGDELRLEGRGLGQGSRVWALVGEGRHPVPLPVREENEESLSVDLGALAEPGLEVDLLVLSAGYQLAVIDVLDDPTVDTGAPELADTGTRADSGGQESVELGRRRASGCSCGASPAIPGTGIVVTLLLAIRRRSH